jgi:hypothetical protein
MSITYHLSSKSTVAREKFSGEAWAKMLSMALAYGWQPTGTRLPSRFEYFEPDAEDWDGTYLTNDGQTVTTEDALALAAALERSLDDIPDFNIDINPVEEDQIKNDIPETLSPVEKAVLEAGLEDHLRGLIEIHPFEYFAGDEKLHLVDFIKFCRLGSFTVLRI